MATLIHIGTLAAMDTYEGNYTNEHPSSVQGTYAAHEMSVMTVSMSDNSVAGLTFSDDGPNTRPADTFTYEKDGVSMTSALDAEARFSAVVQDAAGHSSTVTISVYQLQNGDTFVRLPHGYQITELTIGSMVQDGFGNITTDASSNSTVVCFVAGTLIATPAGPRPVETLRLGDPVVTADSNMQPVRWHHCWEVGATERTMPIRIRAGALAPGVPYRDLLVSPQHRMLIRSEIVQRMFGVPEVLIAAKRLIGSPGVARDKVSGRVRYAHFMCDRHEIVFANGAPTETLYPGPEARKILDSLLKGADAVPEQPDPVRKLLSGKRVHKLVARHAKNRKTLLVPPPGVVRRECAPTGPDASAP